MLITYGPGVTRNVNLPVPAQWLASTPATEGHWYSRTVNRSPGLQAIDRSITTFQQIPTLASFQQMEVAYAAWHQSKINCRGNFSSRRAPASNLLGQQLADHRAWLDDCQRVKRRIERRLLRAIPWKTNTLCAELYTNPQSPAWAPLLATEVSALAAESTLTSQWANVAPATVAGWVTAGHNELTRLNLWENLPPMPELVLNNRFNIQWPPWRNRAVGQPPFAGALVRKGLFCHSYAALAADYIFNHIGALENGTGYRIHSIDLIHQWNQPGQTMQHWWVCVNGPMTIQYGPGVVRDFRSCIDYIRHLPLVGGFVVDIWGALWLDQRLHGPARAISNAATAGDCVWDIPHAGFLGNTRTTKHAREIFP